MTGPVAPQHGLSAGNSAAFNPASRLLVIAPHPDDETIAAAGLLQAARAAGARVGVWLLTDGENTAGSLPPVEAARLARQYGVRIYAVGVGSKGKVPFPGPGGRITMEDMQIDEALLAEVAAVTGGAFYMATDTQALEAIYRRIDALEKTRAESRQTLLPHPLYRWPLAVALGALLALGWLVARRGGRMLG